MASEFSQNNEQNNAQNNIHKEGQAPEKMSVAEAIDKLSEIVKKNESCMAQAFANAPVWQQRAQLTMTTFKGEEGKSNKAAHTVVNVPSTFSKEQKDALKEYAIEMGGTYTNMKVVEQGPDGKENISFPARIEFGNDAAYTPEVCAKMLLGEKKEDLVKVILESNAAHNQSLLMKQDKEKKMSNSEDNSKIASQKKSGLKF